MKFSKPPLSISQQLEKWKARGLIVSDERLASHYLKFIGYYHLSAYALPFQQVHQVVPVGQPDKPFKPGTLFEDVLGLYVFDRELRLLVMDAIERIEVAVRALIVDEMSLQFGSHWFMNAQYFYPNFRHTDLIRKIENELDIPFGQKTPRRPHHETFVNHYFENYNEPYLPPAWMVGETLSLGTWSLIFANLKEGFRRKEIAAPLNVDESVLRTWLHSLTYLRNICAHHARLWNRHFVIKPLIANKHAFFVKNNDRFYTFAVILFDLLQTIAPETEWVKRLRHLFELHPKISISPMGFPEQWDRNPFWKLA